jgi:uroporphyrinogen-III decarboxylase
MPGSDSIQRLLDQVEELYVHPRNQENLKKWVPQPKRSRDNKWRGVPVPVDIASGQIPIVVNMELSLKSAIFGFSVTEFLHNPEVWLENHLRHVIYRFTEIQDDVPILLHIPTSLVAATDFSMWGSEVTYKDDDDPELSRTPLLKDLADVDALPMPDFNHGGMMALARQLYEYVCEQTRGREFTVSFMEWVRGPFGLAMFLYGKEAFLNAMTFDPEGAHRLLNFVTQCRIKWTRQRAEYLGEEEYVTAGQYDDSVSGLTLSPQGYLDFVQPYEMAIAELHGGINYWHSCGDTTKLLEQLSGLPLELFQVGPWTDVQKAAELFGPKGVALEICGSKYKWYGPHPIPAAEDVLRASPEQIESKVRQTVRQVAEGGATAFSLIAGPLGIRADAEQDAKKIIKQVKQWVHTTRTVLAHLDE